MPVFPFIEMTKADLAFSLERGVGHKYTVSETKHQTKMIDHLEGWGFIVTKIVLSTKTGTSDIWAGSPCGQLWIVEAKREDGVLSELQLAKLMAAYRNKAVVMCAYGYEDYKRKFIHLTT